MRNDTPQLAGWIRPFVSACQIVALVGLSLGCASAPVKPSTDFQSMDLAALEDLSNEYARSRFESLLPLIEKSIAAEDCERAQKYAYEALQQAKFTFPEDRLQGEAVFEGHMALGYCELKNNRVGKAEYHLIAASKAGGSPQLESTGLSNRNLTLLRDLLVLGERKIVLKFLENTKNFWKGALADELIAAWSKEIKGGKVPAFNSFTKKPPIEEKTQAVAKAATKPAKPSKSGK